MADPGEPSVIPGHPGISARGVRFGFGPGEFSLTVPFLDVPAGQTVACTGPSGSGKSTLLQLLAGILLPQDGTVAVGDLDWASLPDAARRLRRISLLGLVFQEFELMEHLTVRENILLPYLIQRALVLDGDAEAAMERLARAAGVHDLLHRRPQALSHGERQRVALCRALVTRPAVLLADEPTGNLDPMTTEGVLDLMLAQVRDRGATLVMVTHDHGLLSRFDRVVELSASPGGATVVQNGRS